jgi:hypothetical protein
MLYSPVSQHSVGPLCVFLKIRVFFFFVIIHLFFCLKIGIAKGALVLYWMGIVPAGFRHSNVSDFCYLNLPCTRFQPVQDSAESSLQSRIEAVPSKRLQGVQWPTCRIESRLSHHDDRTRRVCDNSLRHTSQVQPLDAGPSL